MKIKGVECQEAKHLGWRDGDPTRDKNLRGKPIKPNYAVIVRMKDCRLYEKDGREYYDPNDAPCIPMAHGTTYYGYGKRRNRHVETWLFNRDDNKWYLVSRYETTPFYAVKDGRVYQGTIKHLTRNEKGTPQYVIKTEVTE